MNNYNISVIVPIYNSKEYLKTCIESLLNQTFENFEIILIDDGSTDGSSLICDGYARDYDNVKVIHQPNMGVSESRKRALYEAQGDYVTFVDSDDYVKKDFLEILYSNIIKSNSDVVCCNSIDIGLNLPQNKKNTKDEILENREKMLEDFFYGKRYAYCIWAKLYKKDILKKIEFPPMKYGEDTYMMLMIMKLNIKIHLIEYSGYYYVQREKSATFSIINQKKANDILKRSKLLNEICKETNNKKLMNLANKDMGKSLYWAIVENSKIDDAKEIKKILKEFDDLYKYCKCNNIFKLIVINLFAINERFVVNLIKILKWKE